MEFLESLTTHSPSEKIELCHQWLVNHDENEIGYSVVRETLASAEHIAALEANVKRRSLENVVLNFPFVNDATASGPHLPKAHEPAAVVELDLQEERTALKQILMEDVPDFWKAMYVPFKEPGSSCNSEMESVCIVTGLLNAVIRGLGLQKQVGIALNRSVAGLECDILLINELNRLPFAVIEVKKPGNTPNGRKIVFEGLSSDDTKQESKQGNRVAGQIFNQMKAVQLYGYNNVISMITTGNQLRLVGLEPNSDVANFFQENLQAFKKHIVLSSTNKKLKPENNTDSSASPPQVVRSGKAAPVVPGARHIWGSKIVPPHHEDCKNSAAPLGREDPFSIQMIEKYALLVVVGFMSIPDPSRSPFSINIRKQMPCRILQPYDATCNVEGKRTDVFAFGSITVEKVELDHFDPTLKHLYVIHPLGMGDEGQVCLASSKSGGSTAAIKFLHDAKKRTVDAMDECESWRSVYQGMDHDDCFKVYTLALPEGHCLVMPYFHPIPKFERLTYFENGSIEQGLRLFSRRQPDNSFFIHNEVYWRHLGILKRYGAGGVFQQQQHHPGRRTDQRIVLLDLGETTVTKRVFDPLTSEKEINDWVKQSLDNLRERAFPGSVQLLSPSRKGSISNVENAAHYES